MKTGLRKIIAIKMALLICLLVPLAAHSQNDPQQLRKQACERMFEIIVQCQLSADPAGGSCSNLPGIISSPQSREIIRQQRPDGATDSLIDRTLTMTAEMCSVACQKARAGRFYKTAQEWMADGGCTIQVTP